MNAIARELAHRRCAPMPHGARPLDAAAANALLEGVPAWAIEDGTLTRTWRFANYHETMAFVNATAWISHREDHHPDMLFGYNQAKVVYSTHSVGGLSENDFICAAKIDALGAP
jgi:4a-hydroxytetrahydrobiopterin dehydratase